MKKRSNAIVSYLLLHTSSSPQLLTSSSSSSPFQSSEIKVCCAAVLRSETQGRNRSPASSRLTRHTPSEASPQKQSRPHTIPVNATHPIGGLSLACQPHTAYSLRPSLLLKTGSPILQKKSIRLSILPYTTNIGESPLVSIRKRTIQKNLPPYIIIYIYYLKIS